MEPGTVISILKAQEAEIQKEAFLSFEEKIRILIHLQEMVSTIRPDLSYEVWTISDSGEPLNPE